MEPVSRNVILDLLPAYIAGEASDETRNLVEEFAKNDPYNKAGLFEKVTIRRWMGAIGPWLPGSD